MPKVAASDGTQPTRTRLKRCTGGARRCDPARPSSESQGAALARMDGRPPSPADWSARSPERALNARTIRTTSSGSSVSCSRSRSVGVDRAARDERLAHPVQQAGPVRGPDQHDREVADLAGLDEGQRLEQLVERAEAAGQDHERVGVLHEHRLAGEEVAELDAEVDVRVEALLVGQLDVAADRQPAALLAAAVGRLHHARAAAGDDRVAGLGEPRAERSSGPARRSGSLGDRPGRAEDRSPPDRPGHRVEALDELGQDPEHPPRVRVEEGRADAPLEELLVLGRRRVALEHPGRLRRDRQLDPIDEPGVVRSLPSARMPPGRCAMRVRWIGAVGLAAVGLVWIGQGLGLLRGASFDGRRRPSGRSPGAVLADRRRRHRLARPPGPAEGLSQAVQVASAGPAVTSLPWRTSGSRSSRGSASSRRHAGQIGREPGEACSRYARLSVSSRAWAPSRSTNRRSSPGAIGAFAGREVDDDPSLLEEAQGGAGRLVSLEPEDLDVGHLLRRDLAEGRGHGCKRSAGGAVRHGEDRPRIERHGGATQRGTIARTGGAA